MENYEIILSTIFISLLIFFTFFISQKTFLLSEIEKYEKLASIDINTATRYLWKNLCSNSTEYSLKSSEIDYLKNYDCSILPCFINLPVPVFFIINYSNTIYRFGVCSMDYSRCNRRKSYVLIDNTYFGELYTHICYDDLSKLTVLLQYHCDLNESFRFYFSKIIKNLTIKNNTVCLNSNCNNLFCEKFLENYEITDTGLVYFEIEGGFYKVFKIS